MRLRLRLAYSAWDQRREHGYRRRPATEAIRQRPPLTAADRGLLFCCCCVKADVCTSYVGRSSCAKPQAWSARGAGVRATVLRLQDRFMPGRHWRWHVPDAVRPSARVTSNMTGSSAPTTAASPLVCMALVDLFNVGPTARTDHDYEDLMDLVGDLIREGLPRPAPGQVNEVDCRLYGGFFNKQGDPTEQHVRALRAVTRLTGIQQATRIRAQLATSLAYLPATILRATYKNGGQKMVDQMLANDAVHFSGSGDFSPILIIADDDDYVPSVAAIGRQKKMPIIWMRRRAVSYNDTLLRALNVTLTTSGRWQ